MEEFAVNHVATRECKYSTAHNRVLIRDLALLVRFVQVYCEGHHNHAQRQAFVLANFDAALLPRRSVMLCPSCRKLLAHALIKRCHCPMDPKPTCKHCPSHCYHPAYRQQIRQVMKYAGRKLVLRGRLDYLLHLWF